MGEVRVEYVGPVRLLLKSCHEVDLPRLLTGLKRPVNPSGDGKRRTTAEVPLVQVMGVALIDVEPLATG